MALETTTKMMSTDDCGRADSRAKTIKSVAVIDLMK